MKSANDCGRSDPIIIRPADPKECDVLTDLVFRSKAYWGYGPSFMEAVRGELRVLPEEISEGRAFVAQRDGGPPLGVHTLKLRQDDPKTVEIDLCFVAPEAIGSGVGRVLWNHLVTTARAWGGQRVYIESDPNAVGFYEAMGAVPTGELSDPIPPRRRLPILSYDLRD